MLVKAKRFGYNEVLTPEQTHDHDPYDYEDDDLVGELKVIHGHTLTGRPITHHLVNGQEADPDTIEPLGEYPNAEEDIPPEDQDEYEEEMMGNQSSPSVAGVAVRASDTGRVLMLQRTLDDTDSASGKFEFPGGHVEEGETPIECAKREWHEEVGLPFPSGTLVGSWDGSNGKYKCFIFEVPSEEDLDLYKRDTSINPDGDKFQAAAWIEPDHIIFHNPRTEIADDFGRIRSALGN